MSKRSRGILSNIFGILAIIVGVLGLYTLSVWNRALTPDIYTNAFEQSGVYTQVTNLIEAQATEYLKVEGKQIVDNLLAESDQGILQDDRRILNDELIAWMINTVIDNQTANVVDRLSERIDLEQRVANRTESFLQTTTSWLRGEIESPQIIELIPPSEEVAELEPLDLATAGIIYVGKLAFGLDDLPLCSSSQSATEALELIAQGNVREIKCTNEQIDLAINSAIESLLPEEPLRRFKDQIGWRIDLYRIENLFESVQDALMQLSVLKEDLRNFREEVQLVRSIALVLIVFSVLFTLLAFLFANERSAKLVLWIFTITGITLFVTALTTNFVFVTALPNVIDLSRFSVDSEVLSTANAILLENSLTEATEIIASSINDYVLVTALMLLMLSGIPLLLIILYERDVHIKLMNMIRDLVMWVKLHLGNLFGGNTKES